MKDVISALSFVASSIFVCIFDPKNGFDGLVMSGSGAINREECMAIMETENVECDPYLYMSKRRSHCRFSALQGEIQDFDGDEFDNRRTCVLHPCMTATFWDKLKIHLMSSQ